MASDATSSANDVPDSFDSLRAAFAKSYAEFHQSNLCLAMVAGTNIPTELLRAITGSGFYMVTCGAVHAEGDTYSFFLVSAREEKLAVARFNELAARGGAWGLATGRVNGKGTAYSKAGTLWLQAICEALRGTESQKYDGIAYWPLNPFAALIETIQWLEQLNAQPAPVTPPPSDGDGRCDAGASVGESNAEVDALAKDVRKLKSQVQKEKTPREKTRDQRNKFSRPRRKKDETWQTIYAAYSKKFPQDKAASPDTLRLAHNRNPGDE